MNWLSYLLIFLAVLCAIEFLDNVRKGRRRRSAARSRERLQALAARLQLEKGEPEVSIVRERLGAVGLHVDEVLEHIPLFARLELLLYRAGITTPVWRLFLLSGLLGVAVGNAATRELESYALGGAAGVLCAGLPWLYVVWRKRRRMRLFDLQFPEALELVCRALRAGHALSAGLRMVGRELDEPVAGEFTHVADEIALGLETREALANLCHRIDNPDLAFFSTAVIIQRETGGNLAEIMDKLAHLIRERHKFYGKVKAMTAQNRGAALVLLFTPVAFLLMMRAVNYQFIEPLWTTDPGQMLAMVVGGLTLLGYGLARRLAVVKA